MGFLFDILLYSIANIFWGILLAVIGIVLLFVLIKSWYKNASYTLVSYLVGCVLFFFLAFQAIMLCGAVTIKSYCDDVEQNINVWVDKVPENLAFDQEDSRAILQNIIDEWPLVGYFIGDADFSGHTKDNIAASMMDELRSVMNWYIMKRVLWSLFFVVVGAVIVIKTIDVGTSLNTYGSDPDDYGTSDF